VTEIQNALIKGGYLTGPASGQYDEATISAFRKFQAANGLPATGQPNAASLKKLGVAKRSNDGYAVPIKNATHDGVPPPGQDAAKPKP
jgi:peptidoglycan hydrolase-like protein with peptidoglycan-binding domain